MHIGQSKSAESRILYIDEHIAVFNKAAGDICAAFCEERCAERCKTGFESACETPENVLVEENPYLPDVFCGCLEKSSFFNGTFPPFIHCFNRLDRPVSGCVLLVFNRSLIPLLQKQFTDEHKKNSCVQKTYYALLEGRIPLSDEFSLLEHHIRFDAKKQRASVYDTEKRKTKTARLLWRPVFCTERYTLAEIRLLTGRTHQIRAQLSFCGFHIKGDVKYGARRNDILGGIRLHASGLRFRHPVTGSLIDIHAPLLKTDALWDAVFDRIDLKTAGEGNTDG
ncbi:pseudouridine synthase [Treponema sp. HNW]|uniref:RluA family pseudouridine synthase n=1 Tax=Treponema sp. HNW TaxID=3116654 RepID=UPI003D099BB9